LAEGEFSSWRIQTQVPVLSRLPRLLAVVRGDLRLVGVSPLTPAETQARTEEWQHVRDQAPAGLIGPTQLMLPEGASLDERLMSDAFYVGQRHWRKDVRLLGEGLRALFSAHAWRGLSSAPASGR
jgi:lipopolysaccharide/colanic/teichoic acid biosynthesis glycosyltransferase